MAKQKFILSFQALSGRWYSTRRTAPFLAIALMANLGLLPSHAQDDAGGFLGPPPGAFLGKAAKTTTSKSAAKPQSHPRAKPAPVKKVQNAQSNGQPMG